MYTLHQETTDGSLHDAFARHGNKRVALRSAKACARCSDEDLARIVVCDANEMTVATFKREAR